MCRIAGIFDPSMPNLPQEIVRMRDAMKHGGPDDEGIYIDNELPLAFGHRRLSIIDLSSAGHQPMSDLNGDLQIIYNGEIYNYPELKRELISKGHQFKTQSDTEVILKAYIEWGINCFAKLNGMFAIAIFDKLKNELILARDHAGIKPLYFYHDAKSIYFSSEIRGFKAVSKVWDENPEWKIYLMAFGHLPEPVTTLKAVKPLPKGSYMVFNLKTLQFTAQKFNEFVFTNTITDLNEAKQLIRTSLEKAVERHLIADAPLGLFLSGGIDSSLLTLLTQPFKKDNLHTLSIVFDDERFSEKYYQDIIIQKTGARHKSFLVNESNFKESLPDVLKAMDQPSTDGINSYFICKYAKEYGLTAVLSGLGADELLGGYSSFQIAKKLKYTKYIPSFLFAAAELSNSDRYKKISYLQRKDGVGEYLLNRGIFSTKDIATLLDEDQNKVRNVLSNFKLDNDITKLESGNRTTYLETNLYMQNQLLKDTDYMSMWHAIEVRVPFLDKEFISAVYSIDNNLKFERHQGKFLLIEAFKDLLPREIWDRRKQGFTFPFEKWMKGIQPEKPNQKTLSIALTRFKQGNLQWSRYWAYVLTYDKLKIGESIAKIKNILFLNLTAFSQTGGIEKFNKCFLKALSDLENEGIIKSQAFSAYDTEADEKYYSNKNYTGFNKRKFTFTLRSIWYAEKYDIIVLGHINLAIIGYFIKLFNPTKRLLVMAHGIEVWNELPFFKRKVLKNADMILSVSNFTKAKLLSQHKIKQNKVTIFYNAIDPFFDKPLSFTKSEVLKSRYNIKSDDFVLFTLTRLSSIEKYKGYDLVINALPGLKKSIPNIKYILAGKADEIESNHIKSLAEELNLNGTLTLAGYIKDEELIDHYLTSDIFIMPSQKEGFGIVFIEALACGLPVIAGNKDGSVDALQNGKLGTLINPESISEISGSVMKLYSERNNNTIEQKLNLQRSAISTFGFKEYKQRLKGIITEN